MVLPASRITDAGVFRNDQAADLVRNRGAWLEQHFAVVIGFNGAEIVDAALIKGNSAVILCLDRAFVLDAALIKRDTAVIVRNTAGNDQAADLIRRRGLFERHRGTGIDRRQ